MLANIWRYRQFIYSCVKREFQEKYKNSIFGVCWSVFQPLSMIFVYTVIFSQVMKSKLAGMEGTTFAYSIYLCSGILTWGLFSETLLSCVNVFLKNANLMKKVAFPRVCLPAIAVVSALVNFFIGFALFLAFLILIGKFPLAMSPAIVLVLMTQTLFSATLGVGLGVLNVFFRDVGQMLNVILQFWFWFTPVVYPLSIVPEKLRWLVNLNPMYFIVGSYQNIFVYGKAPDWAGLSGVFLLSLAVGSWTRSLYKRHCGELVDEL